MAKQLANSAARRRVAKARSREKAIETIKRLALRFPLGFRFDREDANKR